MIAIFAAFRRKMRNYGEAGESNFRFMYSIEIIIGLIVGAFALLVFVSVGSTIKVTIGILMVVAVAAYVAARALWLKSRRRAQ